MGVDRPGRPGHRGGGDRYPHRQVLGDPARDAHRAKEEEAMTEDEAAWPPEDIELVLDDGSDIDSDSEEIYDGKGNRITDEYVDEAIADVHRAIDEGRVPVPTGRAAKEGKTISALAREAFEQFLRAG